MLPDTPDVERVLTGPDGVLSGLQPGAVVIDMSSISPVATEAARRAGRRHKAGRCSTRRSAAARSARSTRRCRSWSAATRRRSTACGRSSNAWATPSASSTSATSRDRDRSARSATRSRSAARSPASARRSRWRSKAGVDRRACAQALLGGFAASRVLEVHGERMLKGNYEPGFRARLYQKDLRIANETAAAHGVAMPATAVVTQLLNALVADGGGELDYSALGTVCFDWRGSKALTERGTRRRVKRRPRPTTSLDFHRSVLQQPRCALVASQQSRAHRLTVGSEPRLRLAAPVAPSSRRLVVELISSGSDSTSTYIPLCRMFRQCTPNVILSKQVRSLHEQISSRVRPSSVRPPA